MIPSDRSETSPTVEWIGNAATGFLRLIDQTRLPTEFVQIDCHDVPTVWDAIKALRVRGAPAIGIAAAYGAVIGHGLMAAATPNPSVALWAMRPPICALSRPTAVNLFWALDRMDARVAGVPHEGGPAVLERLLLEARQIDVEDRACVAQSAGMVPA